MIRNIILGIITIIIIYCLWWAIDRDSAIRYLPRAFQPEDVDTAINSSGEITKRLFDLSREYGTEAGGIMQEEFEKTRQEQAELKEVNTNKPENMKEEINVEEIRKMTLHTNYGDIKIDLFTDMAPITTKNFVTLAKQGFYDGTRFHRVIDKFMIQGGDPLSIDTSRQAQWGTGGPGYQFQDEIHSENENAIGTIAMANSGPNTNGSQFFINVADNNFLDQKHTVFGQVTDGLDVVLAISRMETNALDRPMVDVLVNSISLE